MFTESIKQEVASLCAAGAAEVRAGKTDALRFDLFNVEEAREVRHVMDTLYPGVPYVRTWVAGGPDPRPGHEPQKDHG